MYMAVEADRYELPIAVEESASALARKMKVTERSIYHSVMKKYSGRNTGVKYIRIEGDKEMGHYVGHDIVERFPITQKEIERIKNKIQVGDRIQKRVSVYGVNTGKKERNKKAYNCRVLAKHTYGVTVERTIRQGLYVRDFISYVEIAEEERRSR